MSAHVKGSFEGKRGLFIEVRGADDRAVESAIRLMGRKMKQEGIIREIKQRSFYEPPSVVKRRKKAEAIRRANRLKSRPER